MNTDWESKCNRCGKCCYHKLELSELIFEHLNSHCEYLNPISRLCSIYETRLEVNPNCLKLTPQNVPNLAWLPLDCGLRSNTNC
jgi:uncharacterized cysteine cluster protein YcgN (CxxCxxCC family)